ncbi:MAG TPA: hypothetical protein VM912_21710 [Terriglobales bacterium]|nr:hypothetical protein [Terriglobales bacterium]
MQPEKRARVMLPVRLQRDSEPLPRKKISACTYDISEHGARITGLQEPLQNGEIVIVERAGNRAKYQVVWMGKPGTPLGGHAGLQLLPNQELIWDVKLAELQEEYEPIILDDNLIPTHREAMFAMGRAQVRVLGSSVQGTGSLVQLSEHECTVLVNQEFPQRLAVTLFVSGEGFDLRLRGTVRAYGSGHLIVDLSDVRRGDRRLLDYLFTLGEKA